MKIALIFPNRDRRYKTVHLGLGYIASYARSIHPGLEFHVLDTRVATRKETERFFRQRYDLVGMTVFSPVYYEVIAIFDRIRKYDPKVPVCLGGPYVTTIMEEVFRRTPADFAVYGEGEITFSELLFHIKGQRSIAEIAGLMYRTGDGTVVTNPPREQIRDLDALPLPAFDLFPMERYPLHRIVSSRGCAYSCSFCNSSSIWSGNWRKRSAADIVREIDHLVRNYGKKIFVFGDNSFNIDAKRLEEFCDLLIAHEAKILWSASIRADLITQQLADKMKAAGCYNVAIGIESANNGILAKVGKRATIEEMTEGIRIFRKAGIEVLGQFVIGNPGDTLATVTESVNWAKKSQLDFVNFYSILPFKGTPQWDYVLEHGHFFTQEIHDFHTVKPRIVYDTPDFPYKDRLAAINLAKRAGFYSNSDKKNWLFDVAKETSRKVTALLPATAGNRIYMAMKAVYRIRMVKKQNY
jgi:anaerobic magnesium-protoporphyrin IX monomethyl ester cyclase